VLQCVAVCCSVLQCVAVCCSVLQTVCYSVMEVRAAEGERDVDRDREKVLLTEWIM